MDLIVEEHAFNLKFFSHLWLSSTSTQNNLWATQRNLMRRGAFKGMAIVNIFVAHMKLTCKSWVLNNPT